MSAIPIPTQQDTDDPEEILRRTGAHAIPIPGVEGTQAASAIPTSRFGGIPTPSTPAIPTEPTPLHKQAGVASLWAKADNIHNPVLRVLGKVGAGLARGIDIAGSVAAPGIAVNIPGSTLHAQAEENRDRRQASEDTVNQERQAVTQHTQAETGAIPATTAKTEADTAKTQADTAELGKPKPKEEEWSTVPNAQGPKGEVIQQEKNSGQMRYGALPGATVKPASDKEDPLDRQYADAIQSGDHETAARILKVKSDLAKAGQAPQRAPQTTVILPSGEVHVAKPGEVLPQGTQNVAGFATQGRPTTQERNISAQAAIAAEGIPQVIHEIDQLGDKLGPVQGRWNDFVQGKLGMDDPKFAGLRADLLMVSSAVALAHARGRLPENLREEFDHMINSPKQTPENIKAVLNHILPWMQRMQQIGNQTGTGGAPAGNENDPLGIR